MVGTRVRYIAENKEEFEDLHASFSTFTDYFTFQENTSLLVYHRASKDVVTISSPSKKGIEGIFSTSQKQKEIILTRASPVSFSLHIGKRKYDVHFEPENFDIIKLG